MILGRLILALAFVLSVIATRPSLDIVGKADGEDVSRSGRKLMGANTYKNGDVVPLWASKVGPFSNPRSVDS